MKVKKISVRSIILPGLIVVAAFLFIASAYKDGSLSGRHNQAARRGIEWLIKNRDEVPPNDAVWLFGDLYKAVKDEEISQELLGIVKDKRSEYAQIDSEVENNISSIETNIYFTLNSLLNRKCMGEDISGDLKRIESEIRKVEQSDGLRPLYLLRKLGIGNEDVYNNRIFDDMAIKGMMEENVSSEQMDNALSYVTHIVLYESDYFDRYLDPIKYPMKVSILQDSLVPLSTSPDVFRRNVDLLSQVLFSLKLLRQKPDAKILELYDGLVEIQNRDGSWSQQEGNVQFTFHNTAMATLALIEFSDNLGNRKAYCPFY